MIRPRVLLADDHNILVEALAGLLQPECEIVGTAGNGRALLTAAVRLRPDVIILDVKMPGLNGLDAARQLRRVLPETRLIFLTMNADRDLAAEAFRIGASGYVLKASAASELFHAVKEALAGRTFITPLLTRETVDSLRRQPLRRQLADKLTPRQREVLELLVEGRTMKEAANILHVTPRTIAFHKYRMMHELGIRTSAELVQFAIKHGLGPV